MHGWLFLCVYGAPLHASQGCVEVSSSQGGRENQVLLIVSLTLGTECRKVPARLFRGLQKFPCHFWPLIAAQIPFPATLLPSPVPPASHPSLRIFIERQRLSLSRGEILPVTCLAFSSLMRLPAPVTHPAVCGSSEPDLRLGLDTRKHRGGCSSTCTVPGGSTLSNMALVQGLQSPGGAVICRVSEI